MNLMHIEYGNWSQSYREPRPVWGPVACSVERIDWEDKTQPLRLPLDESVEAQGVRTIMSSTGGEWWGGIKVERT